MSLSCWRALGSLELVAFTTMLKAFNDYVFKPYIIIVSFPIELGGKTILIEVEVDAPLDYNLLLGHSCIYATMEVVS